MVSKLLLNAKDGILQDNSINPKYANLSVFCQRPGYQKHTRYITNSFRYWARPLFTVPINIRQLTRDIKYSEHSLFSK